MMKQYITAMFYSLLLQFQYKMPENLSPEVAVTEQVEESSRRNASGGYSPHSTTGSNSRELRAHREEEEEEDEEEENSGRGADDSGPSATTTTPLKQILAAAIKLSGTISRQHWDRTLQVVTDLLVSY